MDKITQILQDHKLYTSDTHHRYAGKGSAADVWPPTEISLNQLPRVKASRNLSNLFLTADKQRKKPNQMEKLERKSKRES